MSNDPWKRLPPAYGPHLPGGVLPLSLDLHGGDARPIDVGEVRELHAAVSSALLFGAAHSATGTDLALFQAEGAPSGWAVYLRKTEDAQRLAMTGGPVSLRRERAVLRFGALSRLRAPVVTATGRHLIRLTATTPVVIRSTGAGGRSTRWVEGRPVLHHLAATLAGSLSERLGVKVALADLAMEVLSTATTCPPSILTFPRGHGAERGWVGPLVLAVSPLTRWLLDCAARIGLGGRTSLGFGRVKVEPLPEGAPPMGIPYPADTPEDHASASALLAAERLLQVPAREAPRALRALLARATFADIRGDGTWVMVGDGLRLVVELCALGRRRVVSVVPHTPHRSPSGAVGRFFLTPHAVKEYIARFEPTLPFEQALGKLIRLTAKGRKVGPGSTLSQIPHAEIWETSTTAEGETAIPSARLRFIVGHEEGRVLPFVATVLPDPVISCLAG